jgi:hypothetical protein
MINHEYNRPSVTGPPCNYATLQSYNQNYFGLGRVVTPQLAAARSMEVVLPTYGGVGYNALTLDRAPSCNGYYNMSTSYPNYPNACGKFNASLCRGG